MEKACTPAEVRGVAELFASFDFGYTAEAILGVRGTHTFGNKGLTSILASV
jgi:hypothetical protein